jgi:hypothetical protein
MNNMIFCLKKVSLTREKSMDNWKKMVYDIVKLSQVRGTPPPKLAREKRDWNNPG